MTHSLENTRVLVTGAGGFIGSHLVETLIRAGAQVKAFVRYNSRGDSGFLRMIDPDMRRELEIVAGDLRDGQAVDKAVNGTQVVFHLGALISIPYSYLHPREVVETNVMGTFNVLAACLERGVDRVVHTSTSEVYGTARYAPIDENHPLQGQSPYSASKIGADKLVESYSSSYDLPVVTVRPFNTFGPRQSARAVIPVIITQALTGSQILLGSTHTRRDFTYVDDTVQGFIQAAVKDGVEGETFNLGTGREVTIGEVCELVAGLVDHPVVVAQDNQRLRPIHSEVQRLLSDNRFALEKLGWKPGFSLEEGLANTIDWIRANLALFKVGQYEF